MNNKQLGRKFSTKEINVTAVRHAIANVEGYPTNGTDAEMIRLFEILLRYMKEEDASELLENYDKALEASEVQEVQEVLSCYLKGELTIDFTYVENEELSLYEVMHYIEELENVSIIFPATEEYRKVKEKYYNFRSEKAWHELTEMQECELENLYDYDNPSEICYNGTFYTVREGMVIDR